MASYRPDTPDGYYDDSEIDVDPLPLTCILSSNAKIMLRHAVEDGVMRFCNRARDESWMTAVFGADIDDISVSVSKDGFTSDQNSEISPHELLFYVIIREVKVGEPNPDDCMRIMFGCVLSLTGLPDRPCHVRMLPCTGGQLYTWFGCSLVAKLTASNAPDRLAKINEEFHAAIRMACLNAPPALEDAAMTPAPSRHTYAAVTGNANASSGASV
jgi:hypothetical protein